MKTRFMSFSHHFLMLPALVIFLAVTAENSRADISLGVTLDQFGSPAQNDTSYAIFLSLNTTNVPVTYDEVYSPSSNSYTGIGDGSSFNVFSLPDFNALANELTNGTWKLIINAGDPSQQIYTFKVSLNNFTSNSIFPNVQIFNPADNATMVPANPTFTFTGPASWQSLNVYLDEGFNYFDSATLPVNATSWTSSKSLDPSTDYDFIVLYSTNNVSCLNFTVPMTAGSQTLPGWSATTSLNLQPDSQFATADFSISLQDALDATNLDWTTSGDASWFGQAGVSYDGVSSAQSGTLADDQESVLQTTVTGPGTISFYWQTAGEADEFDLEFDDNGGYVTDIPSQTSWSQFNYNVPAGTHTLTWMAYSGDGSSPDDAGFVDEVVFTPPPPPPPFIPGTWTLTSNLVAATYGENMVLLTNGMAFAYEGSSNGLPNSELETVQLFDPVTGGWAATASAPTIRISPLMATLKDGNVLVCGGGNLNSVDLYNESLARWSSVSPMAVGHWTGTITVLTNGNVLVVGGNDNNGDPTNSVELYNPATQSWTSTPSLADSRASHTATLLTNGLVLVANGVDVQENFLQVAYLYDPGSGTWSNTGSMNTARVGATATLLNNGKVLVAGGFDNNFQSQSSAELYDPASGTWTSAGNMAHPHANHIASLLPNGMVLVAGGGTAYSEIYDPTTGIWGTTSSMNTNRAQIPAVALKDGRVLVAGGYNGSSVYATAETFSLTSVSAATILITDATRRLNGSFQLGFTNVAGSINEIFASTDVATPFANWVQLGIATENPSGKFNFIDSNSTNSPKRFYRVRSP
jgi:N-acetylneuraminic acid mutarotase